MLTSDPVISRPSPRMQHALSRSPVGSTVSLIYRTAARRPVALLHDGGDLVEGQVTRAAGFQDAAAQGGPQRGQERLGRHMDAELAQSLRGRVQHRVAVGGVGAERAAALHGGGELAGLAVVELGAGVVCAVGEGRVVPLNTYHG